MSRSSRPIVAFHAVYFAAAGAVALLDTPARGWAYLGLAVFYNVALPLLLRHVGRGDLFSLWAFLLGVSIFQILPDWVLADLVGTLEFPNIGGPRLDDVIPLAMGGLWVPPLFVALALSRGSAVRAAGLALAIFTVTELLAPVADLWNPTDTATQVAGVALYVLPAEAALGWAAAVAYKAVGTVALPKRIAAALAVSVFYTGALVSAYFLIDVAGWSITT